MSAIAEIRRIACNYVVDGDAGLQGPGAPRARADGILTPTEIVNGIARLGRLIEAAKRVPGSFLPPERYEQMIARLREVLPEARAAVARGEGGYRYMDQSFYERKWAEGLIEPDRIDAADVADALNGDINYGNNDGVVSEREFRAASWYRHRW